MRAADVRFVETSMTESKDMVAELSHRIQADIDHYSGTMPEITAASWRGYLAAMLEWNLIPVAAYDALVAGIPAVKDDPAVAILMGRE
jgi:hypothetical protein